MIARRRERERQRRDRERAASGSESKDKSEKDDKTDKTDRTENGDKSESRDKKSRSKSGRPSRRMDIIDQLDATGIYGNGSVYSPATHDDKSGKLTRVSLSSRWTLRCSQSSQKPKHESKSPDAGIPEGLAEQHAGWGWPA